MMIAVMLNYACGVVMLIVRVVVSVVVTGGGRSGRGYMAGVVVVTMVEW